MKFLVIGAGSIGRRHAGNLLALGHRDVRLVEPDAQRMRRACDEFGITGLRGLEEGLAWHPEAVIVANPTALHVPTALVAAQQGCHLFIEKPLGDGLQGVEELIRVAQERRLATLVGCNMRFHPGPRLVQQALAGGSLGRPLSARFEVGSYLPSWRPGTDYRQSYSAKTALGGGCILDAIHELDLACWYFGFPQEIYCAASRGASLGIETEASAEIVLTYAEELVVSVHVDYVQRWRQRRCEVIAERGSAVWESRESSVMVAREDGEPASLGYDSRYDLNAMYVDELNHFLRCASGQESSCADAAWGARVLRVALAAKESAQSRQPVALARESVASERR